MNYIVQNKEICTSGILPHLEPVPIFHREEVRWGRLGGDAVYIARNMLNLDMDAIEVDFAKAPKSELTNTKTNTAKLYPNPASYEVMIEFDNVLKTNALLEIFGYAGNLLQTQVLSSGYQFVSLSVKDLKAGLYFYKITSDNEEVSKNKLLIIK